MNPTPPPDPFSRVLREWRVAPRRDPQFRPRVWQRIAAAGSPLSWPLYVRRHAQAVAGVLALALALGAFTGRERAQTRVAAARAQLATAYVQGLDARTMRMP